MNLAADADSIQPIPERGNCRVSHTHVLGVIDAKLPQRCRLDASHEHVYCRKRADRRQHDDSTHLHKKAGLA